MKDVVGNLNIGMKQMTLKKANGVPGKKWKVLATET